MLKPDFDSQFVKKPWLNNPVVGHGQENPALVAMVDLTHQLSDFIRAMPDLHGRANSNLLEVDNLLRAATNEAVRLYESVKSRCPKDMVVWLHEAGTWDVPYINNVAEWTPSKTNPQNEMTKHPKDGKRITVFESHELVGKWAYVHNDVYSETPSTRKPMRKRLW